MQTASDKAAPNQILSVKLSMHRVTAPYTQTHLIAPHSLQVKIQPAMVFPHHAFCKAQTASLHQLLAQH